MQHKNVNSTITGFTFERAVGNKIIFFLHGILNLLKLQDRVIEKHDREEEAESKYQLNIVDKSALKTFKRS